MHLTSSEGEPIKTPASIHGHPIHPMLVTVPIGLWLFSFVCDLVLMFANGGPAWNTVAMYCMAGGLAGALLAAVPGAIDLLSLRGESCTTSAKASTVHVPRSRPSRSASPRRVAPA